MILGKIMTCIVIFAAVFSIQLLEWWLHDSDDYMNNDLGILVMIIFSVICVFAFMYFLVSIGVV